MAAREGRCRDPHRPAAGQGREHHRTDRLDHGAAHDEAARELERPPYPRSTRGPAMMVKELLERIVVAYPGASPEAMRTFKPVFLARLGGHEGPALGRGFTLENEKTGEDQ